MKKDKNASISTSQAQQASKSAIANAKVVTDTTTVEQTILERLANLEERVNNLSSDNSRKTRHIQRLQKQLHDVKLENKKLKKENKQLREQLANTPNGTPPSLNSQNSSVPPSKDTIKGSLERAKRTQSLRTKSNRPVGGQRGHKGTTLHQSKHINKVEAMEQVACPNCNEDLSNIQGKIVERRQVIDIYFPQAFVTEFISFEKACPNCGKKVRTPFPEGVNAPVCYGGNLKSLVVYLVEAMNASTNKVKTFIKEIFGIDMSEGTICNMVQSTKEKGQPAYDKIHDMMLDEPVVGGDETTENINGKQRWLWAWQSQRLTYLSGGKGRGAKDFYSEYPDGFPNSIFVSDRLPLYYNVIAKGHQICVAHLLRNLEYLGQLDTKQDWSKRMQALLREAIKQRKHIDWLHIARNDITKRFEELLEESLENLHIEFKRLQNSLRKWEDAVFTFLYDEDVPADNNGSEQAIRKAKAKMKISQCFRSFKGAEAFAVLHSLMDTAKKNGQSAFNVIRTIACPQVMGATPCYKL